MSLLKFKIISQMMHDDYMIVKKTVWKIGCLTKVGFAREFNGIIIQNK